MSDLDQLAISRILGSKVQPFPRTGFGGFSAVNAVGEMLAARPKPPVDLPADDSRDAKIVQAFKKIHKGYSVDRVLADPELALQFFEEAQRLGVDAPQVLINRCLLRIRKASKLKVETTVEEKRNLSPFLIPAEIAFAKVNYHYEANYDELLADPEIGAVFDAIALKIGQGGTSVDYRLAALHLRKNVRSRRRGEEKRLANVDVKDLTQRWHLVGAFDKIALEDLPTAEGIFALTEPSRFLYLTKHPNVREGVELFRDSNLFEALGNRFWTPSLEGISVQLIQRQDAKGIPLRLLELKALEVYKPIFNLLLTA